MKFVHHHILWLALVVGLLLGGFFLWSWRKRRSLIAQFVSLRLLADLSVGVSEVRQRIRMGMMLVAVVFAMLALARPQWGFSWEEAHQKGLDVMMAIDTSRSLLAEDIKPNRLSRARLAAWELAKLATTDRIGLVAFAGSSFVQCPLTLDDDAFRQSLDAIQVGIIPQGGSNIADALNSAASAFSKDSDNHKVIIIFSDGEDHIGGAEAKAEALAESGIRVFTIGLGTVEGELLTLMNPDGSIGYVKDSNGAVVKSRLNESLMKGIAEAGNGFYLPLQGATTMETLYTKGLEPLPKSEFTARIVQRFHERFYWPLGIAIILLIIESFLPDHSLKRRSKLPIDARSQARRAAVIILLLIGTSGSVVASPGSAAKAYSQGKYDEAAQEYERLLGETPDDPRLNFNAGAAAYQSENLDAAHEYFSKALRGEDLELQGKAYYGLANTSYFLGDKAVDPNEKISHWEKAVENFDGALKLKADDANANYNREVVMKKLELLRQQQQQEQDKQQQSDDNKDESQEEKDSEGQQESQDDQEKQDQQPGDEEQEQQPQPDQSQQDSEEQSPESQGEKDEGEGQDEESKESQAQPEEGEETGEEAAEQMQAGRMTEEQAAQLLDAIRSNENALIFAPTNRPPRGRVFFKDW